MSGRVKRGPMTNQLDFGGDSDHNQAAGSSQIQDSLFTIAIPKKGKATVTF